MKGYEDCFRFTVPKRIPKIIRIDGKAFHTFLKHAEKPYDTTVMEAMMSAAEVLISSIGGSARMAYIQSDECSILINDALSLTTEPWLGNNIQKMVSVAASVFAGEFNNSLVSQLAAKAPTEFSGPAAFDARIFLLPDLVEVNNYFVWRQKDAIRNSIQQFGRAQFSNAELQGIRNDVVKEWLATAGHPWELEASWKKQGVVVTSTHKDKDIPLFWENKTYISTLYTPAESVEATNESGPTNP